MAKFSVYLPEEAKALGVIEREAAYCAAVTDIKEEQREVGKRLQQAAKGCWGDIPQDSFIYDIHTRFGGKTLRPLPSVKVVMSNKTLYEPGSLKDGQPKLVMIEPRLLGVLTDHMKDALGIELDDRPRFMPDGAYILTYVGEENAINPEQRSQLVERGQTLDELVREDIRDTKREMYSIPFKASIHADPKPRVGINGWVGTVRVPVGMLLHALLTPMCPHGGYSQVWEDEERGTELKYAVTGRRGETVKYVINGCTTWAPAIDVEDIFILVRLRHQKGMPVVVVHLPYHTALRLCCSFGARRYNVTFADLIRGTILLPQALIPESLVPLEARQGFEGKVVAIDNHDVGPSSQEPTDDVQTDQSTETTAVVEPESVAVPEQDEPDPDEEDDPRWQAVDVIQVDDTELESAESAQPEEETTTTSRDERVVETQSVRDSIIPMPIVEVGQALQDDGQSQTAKAKRNANRARHAARIARANQKSGRAELEPCDETEVNQLIGDSQPRTRLGDLLKVKPITVVAANGNNGETSVPPPSDEAPQVS